MMKYLAIAFFAASASAFVPVQQQRHVVTSLMAERSTSMPFMNRPALLDGSMAGDVGFDPLGLSTIDAVGIDLYWLREAEIKNARVAMMAAAGFIWVEIFGPAPGNEMATAKNQLDAFWQVWDDHPQYIAFGFIMCGLIEMISGIATTTGRESGMRAPGDFGLDPLKIKNDPAKWEKYQLHEIKNGRLAMFAAAGQIMQAWTTDDSALGNLFSIFD